jgi:hypothetical protein
VFQFAHDLDFQSVQGPRGSERALVEFGIGLFFEFFGSSNQFGNFFLFLLETKTLSTSELFFATVDDLWLSPW